jgi:hypothetical protein
MDLPTAHLALFPPKRREQAAMPFAEEGAGTGGAKSPLSPRSWDTPRQPATRVNYQG